MRDRERGTPCPGFEHCCTSPRSGASLPVPPDGEPQLQHPGGRGRRLQNLSAGNWSSEGPRGQGRLQGGAAGGGLCPQREGGPARRGGQGSAGRGAAPAEHAAPAAVRPVTSAPRCKEARAAGAVELLQSEADKVVRAAPCPHAALSRSADATRTLSVAWAGLDPVPPTPPGVASRPASLPPPAGGYAMAELVRRAQRAGAHPARCPPGRGYSGGRAQHHSRDRVRQWDSAPPAQARVPAWWHWASRWVQARRRRAEQEPVGGGLVGWSLVRRGWGRRVVGRACGRSLCGRSRRGQVGGRGVGGQAGRKLIPLGAQPMARRGGRARAAGRCGLQAAKRPCRRTAGAGAAESGAAPSLPARRSPVAALTRPSGLSVFSRRSLHCARPQGQPSPGEPVTQHAAAGQGLGDGGGPSRGPGCPPPGGLQGGGPSSGGGPHSSGTLTPGRSSWHPVEAALPGTDVGDRKCPRGGWG